MALPENLLQCSLIMHLIILPSFLSSHDTSAVFADAFQYQKNHGLSSSYFSRYNTLFTQKKLNLIASPREIGHGSQIVNHNVLFVCNHGVLFQKGRISSPCCRRNRRLHRLAYTRGNDDLYIDGEIDVAESNASTDDEKIDDTTYNLGLKPVILKPKPKHPKIISEKSPTTSFASSIIKNGKRRKQKQLDEDIHNTHDEISDDEMKINVTEILLDKSGNYTWSTSESEKLINLVTSPNETKREMQFLLNITMPSPIDYISKTYGKAADEEEVRNATGIKNADDLSSFASSLMDAFSEVTPQNGIETLLNMTKEIPIDSLADSFSLSSASSPTPLIVPKSKVKPTVNNTKKESTDPAALDLYAIATALMTYPPKMKRSKPQVTATKSKPIKLSNKNPNDPLTINDLERILNENGYVRREELSNITSSISRSQSQTNMTRIDGEVEKKTKGGLAFPQSSVLASKHIRVGTSISSSFFVMLVAVSLQPNLWLAGSIIGAILGNDIAVKKERLSSMNDSDLKITPAGLYGDVSLKVGTKIAREYLKLKDFITGVWFMYRTGQLSYQYYKTYESLDQKFKIQEKMDMWNARFVEGKRNFDKWEQENEIGRKVLAGLRTAWMLEENSYRSQRNRIEGRGSSRYRVIQYTRDIGVWFKKLISAMWDAISGGGQSELRDIIKGVKIQITELSLTVISQRMGAALVALLTVNIVGAMFAMTPSVLGAIALISGLIWPDWVSEAYQKLKDLVEESRARGRGEDKEAARTKKKGNNGPMMDRNNFSFFVQDNGRKQWYRTGQSIFSKFEDKEPKEFFSFEFFQSKSKKRRRKRLRESNNRSDRGWFTR